MGGFPFISRFLDESDVIAQYLKDIYSSVLIKDVIKRNQYVDLGLIIPNMAFSGDSRTCTYRQDIVGNSTYDYYETITIYCKDEAEALRIADGMSHGNAINDRTS